MTYTPDYKKLPADADHLVIARVVRECIQKMHSSGQSYRQISERVCASGNEVSEDAIKTFVSRSYIKRINPGNTTLERLFTFIVNNQNSLPEEIQGYIIENWHVICGRKAGTPIDDNSQLSNRARTLATLFCNWVSVTDSDISRLSSKISGDYVLIRKSVKNAHMIVKSRLVIKLDESKKIIKAFHYHLDRQGIERSSEGFVIPIVRNIYIFLRIEESEGLEYIALREPIQFNFKKLLGFMESMNMGRNLLSARVFLERETEEWKLLKPRFLDTDPILESLPEINSLLLTLLDRETSMTLPEVVLTDAFE